MTNHLFDAIRIVATNGDAPFIEMPDGARFTYADMLSLSAQLAHAVRGLGVQPGDRVAAQVGKGPHVLMLYLACVRCGAVYLPLNTAYTRAELEYFFADAEPRLIVVAAKARDAIAAIAPASAAVVTLDPDGSGSLMERTIGTPGDFADAACGPDDLAAILYTSGTTGRSKGAMLTHANLLSNALALRDHWEVEAADRLIHALPIFHIHGLFVAVNVTLVAGSSMILLPQFDPDEILRLMPRASLLMGVPTFYTRLLQHPGLDMASAFGMRLFISGSAPLLPSTHAEFEARTGHVILERYGMTETGMNTSNPYRGKRLAGTVGMPLPGVSIRIADPETSRTLVAGETGMIEVRGPNLFKGYWRMPERTAAEFTPDGYFITGDLGLIDDGGYLHIVGRNKDLVISGGYNIYPKEIESELDSLGGVEESAVIGLPHADLGEAVTAIVVPAQGVSLDDQMLFDALRPRLARYKQPRRIVFAEGLPRNSMGKVQKNVLRDIYANLYKSPE